MKFLKSKIGIICILGTVLLISFGIVLGVSLNNKIQVEKTESTSADFETQISEETLENASEISIEKLSENITQENT